MSIGHESPEPTGSASARTTGDPLQMTEAEKRAAEWEARHDVAARGRRPGAETVQHYVAHERLVHAAQPHPSDVRPAQPHPSEVHAATGAQQQPGQHTPPPRRPRLRGLLKRLVRRGD
jgi:hypothetical protein